MKSSFLSLNVKDLGKGFVIAVGTVILSGLYPIVNSGRLPNVAELKVCGLAGLSAGVTYLVKNLLTNSDDKLMKKEA